MKAIYFLLPTALFAAPRAYSCPFCDNGGVETATFIVLIFGFFALSMVCAFFVIKKSGLMKNSEQSGASPLKAENIGGQHGQ